MFSLVALFCGSSITTSPIRLGIANEVDSGGSDIGVSLLVCGKRAVTG